MGEIFEDKITRNPEDCDFDLEAVCNSVKFQNKHGNLLIECEINEEEIILKYEIPN